MWCSCCCWVLNVENGAESIIGTLMLLQSHSATDLQLSSEVKSSPSQVLPHSASSSALPASPASATSSNIGSGSKFISKCIRFRWIYVVLLLSVANDVCLRATVPRQPSNKSVAAAQAQPVPASASIPVQNSYAPLQGYVSTNNALNNNAVSTHSILCSCLLCVLTCAILSKCKIVKRDWEFCVYFCRT